MGAPLRASRLFAVAAPAAVLFFGLNLHAQPASGSAPRKPESASVQPALPEALIKLVNQLDVPDLKVRLAASHQLRTGAEVSLADIERALREMQLSPEQHRRLVNAAWHRFKTSPKAAMGVRTSFNSQRGGVYLESATNGFHSAEVLRRGDRLESADGHRLEDFGSLRLVILSREPGYEMPLVVIRDGAVLKTTVRLAPYEQLGAPPLDDGSLMAAFRQYRARDYYDYTSSDGVLESGLPLELWNEASLLEADADLAANSRLLEDEQDAVLVVPGGQARGGMMQASASLGISRQIRAIDPQLPGNRNLMVELQFFEQIMKERERELLATRTQLNNPNVPENQKKELREQIARLQAEIRQYELQIRQRASQIRNR